MDFFTPLVAKDKLHPNFLRMTHQGFGEVECAEFAKWASGFIDRDGKIVKEFQTTFNSSFWEVYIFACIKELGWEVDFQHSAPDFVASTPQGIVVSEATIASHSMDYKPEWENELNSEYLKGVNLDEVLYLATIRLANAISSKHEKFVSSYSELEHVVDKPFVLWVAPFEQPHFYVQNTQAISRVLYGYDKPILLHDSLGPFVVGEASYEIIDKDSGASIDLGFFTDERFKEISAVIFSTTATFSKLRALASDEKASVFFSSKRYNAHGPQPICSILGKKEYSETLMDGLHVFLNPFSTHILPVELFRNREVSLHTIDSGTNEYHIWTPPGFLIQRQCLSFVVQGALKGFPYAVPQSTIYKRPDPPAMLESEMRQIGGYCGQFVDNHLSHYHGWTIIIALCSIDEEWGAQALKGIFWNLGEFVENNKLDEIPFIGASDFFSSKEQALEACQKIIDLTTE